jgi:hypothetical protein
MMVSSALLGYAVLSFFLGYGVGWVFRILEHMGSDFLR